MINNLLTKLIGSQRLSDLHRYNAAKYAKGQMVAEFLDDKGRWYYSFPDEATVPHTRLSEGHTHREYLAVGLSAAMINEAFNTMTELHAHGKHVQASIVLFDMMDLNKKVVNFDSIINIMAVNYVREDEDVVSISSTIHGEKCDFLKSEAEGGRFFFQLPSFLKLLNGQTLSKSDATNLYREFLAQKENLKRRWSILLSELPTKESTVKD